MAEEAVEVEIEESQPEESERKMVLSVCIRAYENGGIDINSDPPAHAYTVLGLLAAVQRQLGG